MAVSAVAGAANETHPGAGLGSSGTQTVAGDILFEKLTASPLPVTAVTFGLSQSSTSGGGAGREAFQDLVFTRTVDRASPKLLQACTKGQHIPKATLRIRGNGSADVSMVVVLEDVFIRSYQTAGNGDAAPTEQVSLSFGKIDYQVDGERVGFDVKRNKGT